MVSVKGRWFGAADSYIACSFLSVFFAWRKSSLVMSTNTYSLWCLKIFWKGTKEMTWWLGVLATLTEDLALVPRTHIRWLPTVCDSSSLGSSVLFGPSSSCMLVVHPNTYYAQINKSLKFLRKIQWFLRSWKYTWNFLLKIIISWLKFLNYFSMRPCRTLSFSKKLFQTRSWNGLNCFSKEF